MVTLQSRIERARALHAKGYNCAQCVAMVFDDISGINESEIARLTAALGGGIGGTRGACGCVTAMAIVDGALNYSQPSDKVAVYSSTRSLVEDFSRLNGSTICAELRSSAHPKPCMSLIEDAIRLIHEKHCE